MPQRCPCLVAWARIVSADGRLRWCERRSERTELTELALSARRFRRVAASHFGA